MDEKKEKSVEFSCACVRNIVDRKNRAEAEVVRLRKRIGYLENLLETPGSIISLLHCHALTEDICRTLGTDDLSDAAMKVQRLKKIADMAGKPQSQTITLGVGINAKMLSEVLGIIAEAVESIPGAKLLDIKEVDA